MIHAFAVAKKTQAATDHARALMVEAEIPSALRRTLSPPLVLLRRALKY